jgi:hypothetical protein
MLYMLVSYVCVCMCLRSKTKLTEADVKFFDGLMFHDALSTEKDMAHALDLEYQRFGDDPHTAYAEKLKKEPQPEGCCIIL